MADDRSDLGFAYLIRKSGEVVFLHRGKHVTTLRGEVAADFLSQAESLGAGELQQVMARLTGNYKRGNERQARNHPRNRP